jgi:hypothetical protein
LAFSRIQGFLAILLLGAVGLLTYRLVMNLGALSGERGEVHARAESTNAEGEEK